MRAEPAVQKVVAGQTAPSSRRNVADSQNRVEKASACESSLLNLPAEPRGRNSSKPNLHGRRFLGAPSTGARTKRFPRRRCSAGERKRPWDFPMVHPPNGPVSKLRYWLAHTDPRPVTRRQDPRKRGYAGRVSNG